MNWKQIFGFSLRFLVLIGCIYAAIHLYEKNFLFSAILLIFIMLLVSFSFWLDYKKSTIEAEKLALSMLHDDYSLMPQLKNSTSLNQKLLKLYYKRKDEHYELYAYKNLFENVLDELDLGVAILEKTTNLDWKMFYVNQRFSKILNLPTYTDWEFYRQRAPHFVKKMEDFNYESVNQSLEIKLDNQEKKAYALRTNRWDSQQKSYYIIALDSIQNILDKKEKQAWFNLMKVISHELMNTLTPIQSLLDNLSYITQENHLTEEDRKDIEISLNTIKSKSKHLVTFVNNYRLVGQLPTPKRKMISVQQMIESVLDLMEPEWKNENINWTVNVDDFSIFADSEMLERVLINLFTNAKHALEGTENKQITIETKQETLRKNVVVTDNGVGIDPQIEDKIFMPFFTTRERGAGIGLSLVKSIMEAHGGYVSFSSDKNQTQFMITFLE